MKKTANSIALILSFILIYTSCTTEPKIYEWRGVDRAGIYYEEGLLEKWPGDGLEVVWEYEGVGTGYGSPIFTEDRM